MRPLIVEVPSPLGLRASGGGTGARGAAGRRPIFNPNLDPDGSIARRLAELIARCVPAALAGTH